MAANIPAKLKTADLTRFCVRAAQLETVKPVVAYWCEYWIANQILTRGLHNGDNETLQYATELMDKLERIKANNATNDAIMDDMAGQAYVEQFASETFDRADRAIHANKVTKQTADTFQAAATFFELVNIWGPPDGETQAKIKYAKWNAVRIARALKEGKDPNESNPKPQPTEEPLPPIDPSDQDEWQTGISSKPHHATVEEIPDGEDQFNRDIATHASADQSLHPAQPSSSSPVPSRPEVSPKDEFSHTEIHDGNVSPLESSQSNDRSGSVGGGFFPLPTFTAESNDSTLPTAPPGDVNDLGLPTQPSFTPGSRSAPDFDPPPSDPSEPQDYYRATPPHVQPSLTSNPHVPMQRPVVQQPPNIQHQTAHEYPPKPVRVPYQPPPVQSRAIGTNLVEVDDEAIAQAQKHARWAISALNFEDTPTAVKELREALRSLGAET